MIYTLKKCEFKKSFEGKQGGEFNVFEIEVEDADAMFTTAELVQKSSTPAPTVGDTLDGTLEPGQYGIKFKKAFEPKGGGGFRPRDPKESKQIIRQSCHKAALQYFTILAYTKQLPEGFGPDEVFRVASLFQADVERIGT